MTPTPPRLLPLLATLLAAPAALVAQPASPPASAAASAVQTQPQIPPRQRQLQEPDRVPVDLTAVAGELAQRLQVERARVPPVAWLPPSVAALACGVPPAQLSTRTTPRDRPAPACAAKQVTSGLVQEMRRELTQEPRGSSGG